MVNQLAGSSSPYLLQHADNPVAWYEWGDEALALAREEDRPILLSIGYAACHWCHVMAHESFENPSTAEVMNRLYVNIKVDREQRPDLDRIYQLAHQAIQRRPGGWPLTVFLDPHTHLPFYIGTYFPKTQRHGLPPFGHVLERVEAWYRSEPGARARQNAALSEFFTRRPPRPTASTTLDVAPLAAAQAVYAREFDDRFGGFGGAPKFPRATQFEFLSGRDDPAARRMVRYSLDRMCRGGLFDQLGGGFFRYSVDERWEIPHFEKMLYDNGLLLATTAGLVDEDTVFDRATRMTAGWIIREMQHPDGGYFASLDADSEGQEGKFYVWDAKDVEEALDDDEWPAFASAFGLDRPPNFEGRWHLHCSSDVDLTDPAIVSASQKLMAARMQRVRPALDDKVLASWNGLAIRGMVRAGLACGERAWIESARAAAEFVRRELWRDGRLCASWRDGKALEMAFLDDYAFMLDGAVALLEHEHDDGLLAFATGLADSMIAHHEDADAGGFYFTSDDHEPLVQRPKSFTDDAIPNGNGVAARALLRLGSMTDSPQYTAAAERTLRAAVAGFREWAHEHAACLVALDAYLRPELPGGSG